METAELLARIVLGSVLTGAIGWERDRHGRAAGLRTHSVVGMAAATFMIVSTRFPSYVSYPADAHVEMDSAHIAAGVVSGIGFVAGGTILKHGVTIRGLTTAAGLWLATAIGLAAGAGLVVIAIGVTALGMIALLVLRRFEDADDSRRFAIALEGSEIDVDGVMARFAALRMTPAHLDVEQEREPEAKTKLRFEVTLPASIDRRQLLAEIHRIPSLSRIGLVAAD
jgi:putative Mg2+ transporter-C (MgtC) family protein